MKKWLLLFIISLIILPMSTFHLSAEQTQTLYHIYDEYGIELTQREDVEIGDRFIDKNFNEYEIYLIDKTTGRARAQYKKTYPRPNITRKNNIEPIASKPKSIALYMTHNDESYIIGDGTESIYGAGGIHDVAKTLKDSLSSYKINVTLDETLHVPHNSSAYSRSNVTAKRLLESKPDALFDIHRDGASRQTYVTTVDGKEQSKIRIVLGQSNPNSAQNLEFALYLLSVAEVDYPWLFHDIYWGKGHYNQALSNKALLFEMGTHTIEKSYVLESAKALAEVINTTLYKTTVSPDQGDLTIGTPDSPNNPTLNDKLENDNQFNSTNPAENPNADNSKSTTLLWPIITVPVIIGTIILIAVIFTQDRRRDRQKKVNDNNKNDKK